MSTDNISSSDLEAAVARFRAVGSVAASAETLQLPNWGDDEWKQLFRFTRTRKVSAGEALIRRGESDRTLYFVLHGELEVIAHSGDGLSKHSSTPSPDRLVPGRWTIAKSQQ
jgi:hypothetical protein